MLLHILLSPVTSQGQQQAVGFAEWPLRSTAEAHDTILYTDVCRCPGLCVRAAAVHRLLDGDSGPRHLGREKDTQCQEYACRGPTLYQADVEFSRPGRPLYGRTNVGFETASLHMIG